ENKNSDKVNILGPKKYKKEISVNKDGFFKDTLKVTEGFYRFFDGVEGSMIYLRNGYNLKMKLNAKEFDETIQYTGVGSKENNFLAAEALLDENFDYRGVLLANEAEFTKIIANKK